MCISSSHDNECLRSTGNRTRRLWWADNYFEIRILRKEFESIASYGHTLVKVLREISDTHLQNDESASALEQTIRTAEMRRDERNSQTVCERDCLRYFNADLGNLPANERQAQIDIWLGSVNIHIMNELDYVHELNNIFLREHQIYSAFPNYLVWKLRIDDSWEASDAVLIQVFSNRHLPPKMI